MGPRNDLLGVEGDQRDGERPAIAVHHCLRDPARLLEIVLDVRRRQVLSTGGDDDVLLAAGDSKEPVLVDLADISCVKPTVDDRLARRLLVLVIALEYV